MKIKTIITVVFSTILLTGLFCRADDWPQFRGPDRNGKSAETGLLKKWPQGGPRLLWHYEGLGKGYSSAAVAKGLIYITGMIGGEGVLFAFDLDGRLKWKVNYGPELSRSYPGARTTPTIDGERLYLISGHGRVACYNAKTGERIWYVDTSEKFHGRNVRWGIAESLLIDGGKVVCTPGGKDATVVALDKMTGKTLWTTRGLSEKSAYCSPVLVEKGSNRLLITMVQKSIVCMDIDSGEIYWRIPNKVSHEISAVSPLYTDGLLYVTNGYRHGGKMFELSQDGTGYTKKWVEKTLDVHHGGVLLIDGNIHGASTRGKWICLEPATGKVLYQDRLVGKGSAIYADGMLYCYGEKSMLALVKAASTGYTMVSSFEITRGSHQHWAHPSISDGRLYLRHGDVLMAFDIKISNRSQDKK
jgi:outer membrane protein assembly factor BamB